jgi:hypothetical protein
MAWKATIDGVDRTTRIEKKPHRVSISMPLNGRATATFTVTPEVSVDRFDEVILYAKDGVTKLFGGVVLKRTMVAIRPNGGDMKTTVDCGDFFTYADWCFTSLSYDVAVTMEDVLDDLIADHLTAYGITLSGSQVTGPTLAPFSWDSKRVSDAIRELCDKSGCVARIDANKVLSLFVPGTSAAPFSITDADENCQELTWGDGDRIPYNKVILVCGTGTRIQTQDFTASGSDNSWEVDLPATTDWPLFWLNGTGVPIGPYEPGVGASLWAYQWDPETHTIYQRSGDADATVGTTLELRYTAQYPFEYPKASGASPVIVARAIKEDVFTFAEAEEVATGVLNQLNQANNRELSIVTRNDDLEPGDLLTVNITSRSLNDTFVVTQVDVELLTGGIWEYTVQATEASVYQGNYLDDWRGLTGGGSTSGGGLAVVTSGFGFVEGDIVANRGAQGPLDGPSALRGQLAKSPFTGPGLQLGAASDQAERWDIFADFIDGGGASIGPGLIISPIVSSQFTLRLGKYTTGGSHDFVLHKTSSSSQLFLGAPTSFGLSTLGHKIDGIYTDDIDATNGYTAYGRATKEGEWSNVTHAGGNFTGSGSMTWTVASGDQLVYRYMNVGKTITVRWRIATSTVGGTPGVALLIAIPAGYTANGDADGVHKYFDNGTRGFGSWYVANGGSVIQLNLADETANWAASTDNTITVGQATFQVN